MAEYTIKDVRDIITRRRKTIIFASVVSFSILFSIILYSRAEPIYEAEAAVKVEKVTTLGELLTGRVQIGDHIATAISMVRSFDVLEATAKKSGLIPSDVKKEGIITNPKYMSVIKDLEQKITVEREKGGGNVILIKVQHTNPVTVKDTANLLAESYKETTFYERNKNILESERIVREELHEAEARLHSSRDKLNSYRKGLALTTVSDEQKALIDTYMTKLRRLNDLTVSTNILREKIKALKMGQVLEGEMHKLIYTPGGVIADILYALNSRLNDLKLRENELLVYYTPGHPELVSLREQKDALISQMVRYTAAREKEESGEIKLLEEDMKVLQDKLKNIPDNALKYSMLEKEVTLNEELYNKILLKQQDVYLKKGELAEEAVIARYAVEPTIPITRITFIGNIIIGFFLAIIFGFISGFIHEAIDTIPHRIENLAEIFGIPLLSVISDWHKPGMFNLVSARYPDISEKDMVRRYLSLPTHFISDSLSAEQYRTAVPTILLISKEKGVKVLAVLHGIRGEGSTTYAANLAISISQAGRSVVLVDADFKSPTIHKLFGIKKQPGITDVLLGNYEWDVAVRRITDLMLGEIKPEHLLSPSGLDNLYILTNGEKIENPSTFINSERMYSTLKELKDFFDFVIIDTASVLTDSEASMFADKIDAAILLSEFERLPRGTLLKLRQQLENLKVKLLGLVVNKTKTTEL